MMRGDIAKLTIFTAFLMLFGTPCCCFMFSTPSQNSRSSSSFPVDNSDPSAEEKKKHILLQRGEVEAKLMALSPSSPLVYHSSQEQGAFVRNADILAREGVVGIDNVLPSSSESDLCQELRDYILDYRQSSQEAVCRDKIPRNERFAKCLLSDHRDDLLLPLTNDAPLVKEALRHILNHAKVGSIIERLLGPDATLFELAALISDPGSARQNIHPDHACSNDNDTKPLVLTCFVALQTVEPNMGPTVWIPHTHTLEMHDRFQRRRVEDVFASPLSPKDELLQSMPHFVGTPMPAGSSALFDSRLLHAGTANTSEQHQSRVLFYFSFQRRNASVGVERGSLGYGLDQAALTVSDSLKME
jgi:ectoine hydroxylase-related dioxygenase (phytanoyl-CoA dioxygenase family)